MKAPSKVRLDLERLRDELSERLTRIRVDRTRAEQPLSPDFSEQAVERENDDVLYRLELATKTDLRQVNSSLARLEAGLYGQCEVCGGEISEQRLHAVPQATVCQTCATKKPGGRS